jgi:hypothetical protein
MRSLSTDFLSNFSSSAISLIEMPDSYIRDSLFSSHWLTFDVFPIVSLLLILTLHTTEVEDKD